MVNVLPHAEQKRLTVRYLTRLATTALFMVTVACCAGLLFLVPSYFLAIEQVDASERYRAAVLGTVDLHEEDMIERTSASVSERVRVAKEFDATTRGVTVVSDLLATSRVRVALLKIGITRGEGVLRVQVGGVATTRTDLLTFAEELRKSGTFSNIALPVSQLVLERDVPFTLEADYVKQ